MEIHGDAPEVVEHWITVLAERGAQEPVGHGVPEAAEQPRRRRRRRGDVRSGPFNDTGQGQGATGTHVDTSAILRPSRYPFFRSNSCMNATSASTPASGKAL